MPGECARLLLLRFAPSLQFDCPFKTTLFVTQGTVVYWHVCPSNADSLYTHSVTQHLNLSLICDQSAKDPNPRFLSYSSGRLALEWSTPDACPRSGGLLGGGGGSSSGGVGLWGLIKFLFWLLVIGLFIYFAIGTSVAHACRASQRNKVAEAGCRHVLQSPTILCQGLGPCTSPRLLAECTGNAPRSVLTSLCGG